MNNTLRPIVDGGCSSIPPCPASCDIFWARSYSAKFDETGDRYMLSDALYKYERVLQHVRICDDCRQEAQVAIDQLQYL